MSNKKADGSSQFLILNIGQHHFAADVRHIQDVIKRRQTTRVPLAKRHIVGLLNLRGHIVTEISVARTLGIKETVMAAGEGFTVVINRNEELYSLLFDGIGDVIEISPSEIEPLPETVERRWHQISKGVYRQEEKLLVILDFALLMGLMSDEEHSPAQAIA